VVKGSLIWYNIDTIKTLIKPSKERIMIISENIEKVKRKALNLINKTSSSLSKPEKKFVLEMVLGMVTSGSSNISEIGRALHEPMGLKHTTKRLERMLTHNHILDVCNQLCLEESVDKIDENMVIALDGGDTVHPYGEKFEHLNYVRDGSAKKLEKGYWLNQISGYNPGSHETFPIALDVYSTSERGYKSANTESINLVKSTLDLIGTQGLWGIVKSFMKKSEVEATMHVARREVSRPPTNCVSAHSRTGNSSATKIQCSGTEIKKGQNWGEETLQKGGEPEKTRN
jgi:hypothetical protein